MPSKKKKKQRETRRTRKAKLQERGGESGNGKAAPPSNDNLDAVLTACVVELAHHSEACFEFAYRNFEKMKRGCLFWMFEDIETAKKLIQMKDNLPRLSYHSRQLAQTFQYPPVIEFIDKYDPRMDFVALIAIRTGDVRDSIMKVTHLNKSANRQAIINAERTLSRLAFQFSGTTMWLSNGLRICSNHLCKQVEAKEGSFKKCGGCKHRQYCSRACQILHWKHVHKSSCKAEAEWTNWQRKRDEAIALEKKEIEVAEEIKKLQMQKLMLEKAKKAQTKEIVSVGTETNSSDNSVEA